MTINLSAAREYVHADTTDPKTVSVQGDPCFYGEADVTFDHNDGKLVQDSPKVLTTGVWFITTGHSDLNVIDAPEGAKADIAAPADTSQTKRKPAKKAAAKKSAKKAPAKKK